MLIEASPKLIIRRRISWLASSGQQRQV